MVKEAYCSFEVAKLLKEKGFNCPCRVLYSYIGEFNNDVCNRDVDWNSISPNGDISAPTHQMAMAWLREVHKLFIAIWWDCGANIGKNTFFYLIDRMDNYEDKRYNKLGFDSYEGAVEAAIKYCLENLI